MSVHFSEFVVDGVLGDIYDKTAVHEDDFVDTLDENVNPTVVILYENLGVDFDGE